MKAQYATNEMVPALRDLWDCCFPGEGDTYCNLYFREYFDPHHCCVITDEDGALAASLYWFDGVLETGGARLPVILLYAGCTYPQYRKRGLMTKILAFITEHCKHNGVYAFWANTQPSSKGLTEKIGMVPCFYLSETMCRPSGGSPSVAAELAFAPCDFDAFSAMRQAYLAPMPHTIAWEEKDLRYMFSDVRDSGAVLKTQLSGQTYYAVVTHKESYLLIRESNLPLSQGQALVDGVCRHFSYDGPVKLQTPLGQVPLITVPGAETQEAYFAHLKVLSPHDALVPFQEADPKALGAYGNLTAN